MSFFSRLKTLWELSKIETPQEEKKIEIRLLKSLNKQMAKIVEMENKDLFKD